MKRNSILLTSLLILLFTFVVVSSHLFSQNISSEDLFRILRKSYNDKLPDDFTAYMEGDKITKDLQTVPEYEKIDPHKPFKVKFIFIKEYGERIIVENACLLTRNKFRSYLEVYKTFRTFLDPAVTSESFFHKYKWTIVDNNKRYYVIKMETRGIPNEYYLMYVDKKSLLLARAFYFQDGTEMGKVNMTYKKEGDFIVPSSFSGYSYILNQFKRLEKKTFSLNLYEFNINQKLTVDDILGDDDIDC